MTEEVSKPEPTDYTKKDDLPPGPPMITAAQAKFAKDLKTQKGVDAPEDVLLLEKHFGVYDMADLTKTQASSYIDLLKGSADKGKKTDEPAQTPTKQENATKPTAERKTIPQPTQETAIVSQETKANYLVLEEGLKVSQKLKALIEEHKLFSPIGGKKYVRAEGWQLLGAMFGYSIQTQTYTMDAGEGYRSVVKLYDQTGKILSEATAICTRKEKNWKTRDDYALYSMAQTRALGKAYRMRFAWIMMMSGFEGTPAEEMED